ncbi:MAG: S-layer homology domain-containing protein, partial [Caldilineaceae bacterium]|nr:S-layer homology domain-containing protein [Caldilineaceae bacterium]
MFASLSRFRRRIAVLTVLAMVASVLVAVPAVAADPKADYTATFDACVGVGSADFEDVPSRHTNAGDIDCIAYYGITRGTSETTYSPLMSVNREHMALFLVRLANRVGIEVASDPSDPGFTDTGDLSEESQTAIAQLADLGITQGTSTSTYSPADNVSRAHMALFIARLMDKMTPAADGQVGLSSTTQYGYTPANVKKNAKEASILSPFTDLGRVTKDEYDAITRLYELDVVSGVALTQYSPASDMTRAAMAEFMAAVMDHSNLRPAGLSIQASPTTSWGAGSPTVVVSVRDDMFMAVEDQAVDVFSSAAENNGLRNDGTCNFEAGDDVLRGSIDGDCVWNDNDDATDADGNLFTSGDVDTGTTRVFYAWIGSKNGDKFDADKVDEATVSVSAKAAQGSLKVSSTINKNADTTYDGPDENTTPGDDADALGAKVDLRAVSSVTFSAQLKDSDGANVARSGVSVRVEYKQDDSYQN